MLLEHGLGMDALVSVCPWNTNVILVWARMIDRCKNPGVLQISILQAHWHGCSGERMLLEHERYYGLGMDALRAYALGTRTLYYGLGMDDLVIVCS